MYNGVWGKALEAGEFSRISVKSKPKVTFYCKLLKKWGSRMY